MNLKNILFTALTALTLFSAPLCAASEKAAFVFVNDDSGAMTDMEHVPQLRDRMLKQFNTLKKKARRYARADLVLISTSKARPVWYGKISDLGGKRGHEVIDRTTNDPKRCNQIAASFKAVRNAIKQLDRQGATEIHIVVFSSLISTPIPCDKIVRIDLPQLPVQVDWLASLTPTDHVNSVTFYGVNTHQHPVYTQSLEPLAGWGEKRGKTFDIHDFESTSNALRFGLGGIEK